MWFLQKRLVFDSTYQFMVTYTVLTFFMMRWNTYIHFVIKMKQTFEFVTCCFSPFIGFYGIFFRDFNRYFSKQFWFREILISNVMCCFTDLSLWFFFFFRFQNSVWIDSFSFWIFLRSEEALIGYLSIGIRGFYQISLDRLFLRSICFLIGFWLFPRSNLSTFDSFYVQFILRSTVKLLPCLTVFTSDSFGFSHKRSEEGTFVQNSLVEKIRLNLRKTFCYLYASRSNIFR